MDDCSFSSFFFLYMILQPIPLLYLWIEVGCMAAPFLLRATFKGIGQTCLCSFFVYKSVPCWLKCLCFLFVFSCSLSFFDGFSAFCFSKNYVISLWKSGIDSTSLVYKIILLKGCYANYLLCHVVIKESCYSQ